MEQLIHMNETAEVKTINEHPVRLTKSGKVDMRGKIKNQKKLTEEEVKMNAYLSCKKYHLHHKEDHNRAYKKYYDNNKIKINEKRKLASLKKKNFKVLVKQLEKKLTKIWRIKGLV